MTLDGARTVAPGAFYRLHTVRAIAEAPDPVICDKATAIRDRGRRFTIDQLEHRRMLEDPTSLIARPIAGRSRISNDRRRVR
jgi:hypothetical protein